MERDPQSRAGDGIGRLPGLRLQGLVRGVRVQVPLSAQTEIMLGNPLDLWVHRLMLRLLWTIF